MTETDRAWLAGLFDGEGCVMIHERVRKRGGSLGINYSLRVCINMTSAPTISAVARLTGIGRVSVKEGSGPRRRQFMWRAVYRQAEQFLETIRPYSVTKRPEIDACIEAMDIRRSDKRSGTRMRLGANTVAALKEKAQLVSRMKLVEFPANFPIVDEVIAERKVD